MGQVPDLPDGNTGFLHWAGRNVGNLPHEGVVTNGDVARTTACATYCTAIVTGGLARGAEPTGVTVTTTGICPGATPAGT